jgi:hypothetical protein
MVVISARSYRALTLVGGALVLSSCAFPTKTSASCESATATYKYPGGQFHGEHFEQRGWRRFTSEFPPKDAAPEYRESYEKMAKELMPLVDCSTPDVACLRTYNKVFAVPKGEIKAGARYVMEGADITIEGCLRSIGTECATALYISDCRSPDGRPTMPMGVIEGNDCRVGGRGEQVMFVFDRDRGVIAYEPADWWVHGTNISGWDLSTLGKSAGLLALVEPKGLLACQGNQ